ncbi:RNA binding protein, heterogenous nuclear RNP-K like protein [Phlyctochytrium bullatum]|nr:RNA binding protein, heterogenous nuclear RNP-K like protein [Phlyctochytrium bullatum]
MIAEDKYSFSAPDQAIAHLTGLTLNPETPPHQPHNYVDPDPAYGDSQYDDDDDEDESESQSASVAPSSAIAQGAIPSSTTPAPVEPPTITLRSLVTTKEAGVIIGKGGKNVAEVREETGVKAGVSKVIPGVHERILTITGPTLSVAKAYSMIAQHLLDNPVSSQPPQYADCTTIRLLVSHQLMGSIIGKAGAKIKDIQEESGAKLVISKEMLPQSTERIIEVFGLVESIKIAVYNISECILNDIERGAGTILYNPQVRLNYNGGASVPRTGRFDETPGFSAGGSGREGGSSGRTGGRGTTPTNSYPGGSGRRGDRSNGFNPVVVSNSNASGEQTQTLAIPSDMVGCVIGKGGTFINSIRRQSGARLRIQEAVEGSSERVITIVGTPSANSKALQMLYDQLESEKNRRMNNGVDIDE